MIFYNFWQIWATLLIFERWWFFWKTSKQKSLYKFLIFHAENHLTAVARPCNMNYVLRMGQLVWWTWYLLLLLNHTFLWNKWWQNGRKCLLLPPPPLTAKEYKNQQKFLKIKFISASKNEFTWIWHDLNFKWGLSEILYDFFLFFFCTFCTLRSTFLIVIR